MDPISGAIQLKLAHRTWHSMLPYNQGRPGFRCCCLLRMSGALSGLFYSACSRDACIYPWEREGRSHVTCRMSCKWEGRIQYELLLAVCPCVGSQSRYTWILVGSSADCSQG